MNNIETSAVKQSIAASPNENLSRNLRQAIKVINAEYQQIDWEDQAFLNCVLTNAIEILEGKGELKMAITNRGKDTWLVRIFIGRDSNGKRRYFNETVKGKKKDAQEFETRKKSELNAGISIDHSRITVDEYLDKYFEISAKSRLKERTFEDCLEYMKRYVCPALGTKQLSKIKPLDIQAIYTKMLESELVPRTIRY